MASNRGRTAVGEGPAVERKRDRAALAGRQTDLQKRLEFDARTLDFGILFTDVDLRGIGPCNFVRISDGKRCADGIVGMRRGSVELDAVFDGWVELLRLALPPSSMLTASSSTAVMKALTNALIFWEHEMARGAVALSSTVLKLAPVESR